MPDEETSSTYKPPVLDLFGEEHVRQYRATDGEVGYEWNGASCLLLTTIGRKSGAAAYATLDLQPLWRCLRRGVASQGGAPDHPSWYLNLVSNPTVEVQVEGRPLYRHRTHRRGEERTSFGSCRP